MSAGVKARERAIGIIRPMLGVFFLVLIWWIANNSAWVSNRLLPNPFATFGTLWESIVSGDMNGDLGATLYRTLYAFAMAAVLGLPVGIALGSNERFYRSVEVLIDFFRSTPATAMFPLFLLIFGIGDFAKVSIAAFSAWLVIVFNAAYGVMNSRKTRILAARVMGASRWRVFKDVLLYESLPQTFVGLRMAVSMALVVIIVAEMFIGSSNGMGHRIIDAQQVFDLQQMYASILVTGGVGYGFNVLFIALEKWIVHWQGR